MKSKGKGKKEVWVGVLIGMLCMVWWMVIGIDVRTERIEKAIREVIEKKCEKLRVRP